MRDRVALTAQPADPCPGRHCWVLSGAGDLDVGQRRPALLVEWRQTRGTWEGRVVYLSEVAPGRWVLTEEWMSAALLTPS
jgi:hypothetical protein